MQWKSLSATRSMGEPTPSEVFFDRRRFVSALGLGVIGASTGQCLVAGPEEEGARIGQEQSSGNRGRSGKRRPIEVPLQRDEVFPAKKNPGFLSGPSGIPMERTPREVAALHNNFYEFLPGGGGPVWKYTKDFEVEPWSVKVTGECNKPTTFDLDDLFSFSHEERMYHFRCVERWAMTVPWSGFPLAKLLAKVEPTSKAKFVRFTSANRPKQMPGVRDASYYNWPYVEALRMDEAMNELAMVATGVYGEPLLKQHGSPLRIVVPWKYGFKNPKSIVHIELLEQEPRTFWQVQAHEYGFISNINPNIPHPRWSQEKSKWLHNEEWFPTPIFNGYGEQVADLYPDEPREPQAPLKKGQIAR